MLIKVDLNLIFLYIQSLLNKTGYGHEKIKWKYENNNNNNKVNEEIDDMWKILF